MIVFQFYFLNFLNLSNSYFILINFSFFIFPFIFIKYYIIKNYKNLKKIIKKKENEQIIRNYIYEYKKQKYCYPCTRNEISFNDKIIEIKDNDNIKDNENKQQQPDSDLSKIIIKKNIKI